MVGLAIAQALPATSEEMTQLRSAASSFALTVDGAAATLIELPLSEGADFAYRRWQHLTSFTAGNHTLVGRWWWDGAQIQVTTVTIRAAG